jgi:hypothetical protein
MVTAGDSGGFVGLLFQPRWCGDRLTGAVGGRQPAQSTDRETVYLTALQALMLGDASRFVDVFTDDVVVSGPHLNVQCLVSLQRAVGTPEDSFSDVGLALSSLDAVGDKLIGEWQLHARFTGPVLYDDRVLIEPTGGAVRLSGASVAEYHGNRIRAFRHYFDDTELLAGVANPPSLLRWRLDE